MITKLKPTMSTVVDAVLSHKGMALHEIQLNTRKRPVVYVRQLTMYMLTMYTNMNQRKISELFNKDHTTVIHSVQTINDLLCYDEGVKSDVAAIKILIGE